MSGSYEVHGINALKVKQTFLLGYKFMSNCEINSCIKIFFQRKRWKFFRWHLNAKKIVKKKGTNYRVASIRGGYKIISIGYETNVSGSNK